MKVNFGDSFRNKIGKLFYEFSAPRLTGFGGLIPLAVFLEKLGVESCLGSLDLGYQPRKYPVARILSCLLLGMVAGLDRIREVARLGRDRTFLRALGWSCFPVQSTLSRVLSKFNEARVESLLEVSSALLSKFRKQWQGYRVLHLDLDSHVRTVYGAKVENAKKGYNATKRGRKSFHPLLAFVGETRDMIRCILRPGDAHTANGALEFLTKCFETIGLERLEKLVVRADSGFCSANFLQFLESHTDKIIYAIALRLNPVHQRRFVTLAFTCMPGSKPEDGLEIADYQSSDWTDGKTRRVVVIRQLIPEDKTAAEVIGKQLRLFELRNYTWRAIVTSSVAPPEEVWRNYNQRACCENHIKEALDFGLDWTASRSFWANAAHLALVMLAYNIFNWYKEIAFVQTETRNTVRFLRTCIINVPAVLKRSSRQLRLSFPVDWPWRENFEKGLRRIETWHLAPT